MIESLRDQMLKLGFTAKPPEPVKPRPPTPQRAPQHPPQEMARRDASRPPGDRGRHHAKPQTPRPLASSAVAQSQEEIDLAKAYALRAKAEREEAQAAQREAEARAKDKRERRAKLAELLKDKALNVTDAEHPRHFQHQDKIKRVYCTEAQLAQINAGDLGVIMHDGRFQIVTREVAIAVRELEARCLMVLLEPGEFEAEMDAGLAP